MKKNERKKYPLNKMALQVWEKIVISLAVSLIAWSISNYGFRFHAGINLFVGVLIFVIMIIIMLLVVGKNSFKENMKCGIRTHPILPIEPALSKSDIRKWVDSINSKLTEECQDCVVNSIFDLWSSNSLKEVQHMTPKEQRQILNALLAFDCNKQCVIPSQGLTQKDVEKWLSTVIHGHLDGDYFSCIVNAIMKLWSVKNFNDVKQKSIQEQKNVVEAIWLLHCPHCDIEKMDKEDVEEWVESNLTGSKPDCYNCIVDNIMKLWSEQDFKRVKKMKKDSQIQILQALSSIHCIKQCIKVPSGLSKPKVINWLSSILTGEKPNCMNCVVDHIMELWTPSTFKHVTQMDKAEQNKIVKGIASLNCPNECVHVNLEFSSVLNWVKKVLVEGNTSCQKCVAEKIYNDWKSSPKGSIEFAEVQAMPLNEQIKLIKTVGDFKCSHICPCYV